MSRETKPLPLPWSFVAKITNSKHQICPGFARTPHLWVGPQFQINHKSQTGSKRLVFLFWILNFGHCYLFVIWDLLFEISTKQIPSGDNQSRVLWARILYFVSASALSAAPRTMGSGS